MRFFCTRPTSAIFPTPTCFAATMWTFFRSSIREVFTMHTTMTFNTKRLTISYVKSQIWVIRPRFYVMSMKLFFVTAHLASIAISFEYAYPPQSNSFAIFNAASVRHPMLISWRILSDLVRESTFLATINCLFFEGIKLVVAVGANFYVWYSTGRPTLFRAVMCCIFAIGFCFKLLSTFLADTQYAPTTFLDNTRSRFVTLVFAWPQRSGISAFLATMFSRTTISLFKRRSTIKTYQHWSVIQLARTFFRTSESDLSMCSYKVFSTHTTSSCPARNAVFLTRASNCEHIITARTYFRHCISCLCSIIAHFQRLKKLGLEVSRVDGD